MVMLCQGTLFRLPLRTEQQARDGRLSSHAYTVDDMLALLNKVFDVYDIFDDCIIIASLNQRRE